MSRLASACLLAGMMTAASVGTAVAAEDTDRYAWLEDVTGDKPLSWVKEQNARSEARLAQTPAFKQMETSIREVLDSDAKIPGVQKIGDYYYNFWKDQQHERGLWRRTTLAEYRKASPQSQFYHKAGATPDEADDSAALYAFVRQRSVLSPAAIEKIDVKTPSLNLHFQPGDRVTSSPESRDLFSCRRDNRSRVWIERAHVEFTNQCTNLHLVRQRF